MHLFNIKTMHLEEFFDDKAPPYAILSHTWGPDEEELTFQDIKSGKVNKPGEGSVKLHGCLSKSKDDGLDYFWNDTFCIDKTNLVELSEAIRSMFRWYQRATVCYVYLRDFKAKDARSPDADFGACRWFTRGWTLQELLAPKEVRFYNSRWKTLGTRGNLRSLIERATGIPRQFLLGITPLRAASVAQRMSWAARRETRRAEDRAYSLLGLFDVSVPVIYGEGGEQAFWRLQDQIMRTTRDDSILAWGFAGDNTPNRWENPTLGRVLAASPSDFAHSGSIAYHERPEAPINNLELSGGSLRTRMRLVPLETDPERVGKAEKICSVRAMMGFLSCGPEHDPEQLVVIPLIKAPNGGPDEYVRPKNWAARLHKDVVVPEDTTTALVHIRNDDDSQVSTVGSGKQYVLFDEQFAELGLDVMEVLPVPSWDPESALLTAAVKLDGSDASPTHIRLRQRDSTACDFIISLEFTGSVASGVDRAQYPLMICDRAARLLDMVAARDTLPSKLRALEEASNGELHLRIALRPIPRQSLFVLRPERLSSPPATTANISTEIKRVRLVGDLVFAISKNKTHDKDFRQLQEVLQNSARKADELESRRDDLKKRISELESNLFSVEQDLNSESSLVGSCRIQLEAISKSFIPHEFIEELWDEFRRTEHIQEQQTAPDGDVLLRWAINNDYDFLAQKWVDHLGLSMPPKRATSPFKVEWDLSRERVVDPGLVEPPKSAESPEIIVDPGLAESPERMEIRKSPARGSHRRIPIPSHRRTYMTRTRPRGYKQTRSYVGPAGPVREETAKPTQQPTGGNGLQTFLQDPDDGAISRIPALVPAAIAGNTQAVNDLGSKVDDYDRDGRAALLHPANPVTVANRRPPLVYTRPPEELDLSLPSISELTRIQQDRRIEQELWERPRPLERPGEPRSSFRASFMKYFGKGSSSAESRWQ